MRSGAAAPPAAPTARPALRVACLPIGARRRERMSKRRETIARRLVEAQHNAAMLTTFNEVDMTAIMTLRERQKEAFKKEFGVGLGIASFFVKASIAALRAFPPLNAEIQGTEIVYKNYFDIGMAVGAEGGLVVPVIRDADRMSFPQLELAIRDFRRPRSGRNADARGPQGRHVYNHQWRGLRVTVEHADPQPAPGRHPRPAQDSGPGGPGQRAGCHPTDDVRRAVLRPPDRGWT